MKSIVAVSLTLFACASAGAGELIFANGNRLAGELSNETLMVSTGGGLIEVVPDEVLALSREEIRLRDGRVIQGTLVGGQVKARTSLGEIAVKVEDLQGYRAGTQSGESTSAASPVAAARPASSTTASTPPATPVAVGSARNDTGISGGLPTVAAYQESPSTRQGNGASSISVQTAALSPGSAVPPGGRALQVVGATLLYREALFGSSRVGQVAAGQQVRYVDSIDRRLRILNMLVFDGGHWVKIRVPDGTEGWVPADTVREVE
jgi:hypothetical protein